MSTRAPSAVPIARRQLQWRPGRTLAGVAGIAVALLLVIALNAIFAGVEDRLTGYIDATGSSVIVAQEGVQTMHMSESALPAAAVDDVRAVDGVEAAEGILYRSAFAEGGTRGGSGVVALIGGGPVPGLFNGRRPGPGEVVIDRVLADRLGIGLGGVVSLLGTRLRVSGQVEGTAGITNSFAFVTRPTMERIARVTGVVSYVLVDAGPGVDEGTLASRIVQDVPGISASTRRAFAASERRVIGDMTTDVVRGMTLAAFVIGVAVAGLVAFSQTLRQLRDFGVLRALGMDAGRAVLLALAQVVALVVAAFGAALALTELLAAVLPRLSPTLVLSIRAGDVALAAAVAGAVAIAAATLPVIRVIRIEPAGVFRRAS